MGRPKGRARLYFRHGLFHGDWTTPDGRRVRRALSADHHEAQTLLAKHTAHLRGGVEEAALPRLTKAAPLAAFLAAYARRLEDEARPQTVRAFGTARKPLEAGLGARTPARALRLADLERYVAMRRVHVSPRTVQRELACLRAALRWAYANEYLDRLPAKFPMPKIPRRLRRRITPDEVQLLLAKCPDQRTRVLVSLAWFALLRKSEALHLRWTDLTLEGEKPELRVTAKPDVDWRPKTHHERRVPLHAQLLAELRAWREHCPASRGGWVLPAKPGSDGGRWTTPHKPVAKAFRTAGLQGFGLHALRAGAATDLVVRRGVPTLTVRDVGGWSSTSTLEQFYADADQDALRDAVARIGA